MSVMNLECPYCDQIAGCNLRVGVYHRSALGLKIFVVLVFLHTNMEIIPIDPNRRTIMKPRLACQRNRDPYSSF
jgi:hypothetical protein